MSFNPVFESAMSTARLGPYRAIASDDDHAWALYRWNLRLVAALVPLSSDFEVALRNAIHDQLTIHFKRADWWASHELVLDDATTSSIAAATRRHQRQLARGQVGPGKVVAELMLGTWVMLLSRGGVSGLGRTVDYETQLWRPSLRYGFDIGTRTAKGRVRRPTRDVVHARASNFQQLRNRAAHHEPVFNGIVIAGTNNQRVALDVVRDETIELLSWISPDLAALHRADPAFGAALGSRP